MEATGTSWRVGREVCALAHLEPARSAALLRVINGKLEVWEAEQARSQCELDGFAIIEARDLNDAIRVAAQLPSARLGTVEVRAIRSEGYSSPVSGSTSR